MMTMRSMIATAAAVVMLGGCDLDPKAVGEDVVDGVGDALDVGGQKLKEADIKAKIEAKLFDDLDCSGRFRQESREVLVSRVKDANVSELISKPRDAADLAFRVMATTDATLLMVGNLVKLAQVGHINTALVEGWEALECNTTETFACVDELTEREEGSGSTSVMCASSDRISAVGASFGEGCRLFGTLNTGEVLFERAQSDGPDIMSFAGFALGSVMQIDGELSAIGDDSLERLAVLEAQTLVVSSNRGKSCEEVLTLREWDARSAPAREIVKLDLDHKKEGKTIGVTTLGEGLSFDTGDSCPCPTAGSAMEIRLPAPLGDGDATARLKVTYGAPEAGSATCRSVRVDVLSWPTSCGLSSVVDCGKGAIAGLLTGLVAGTCLAVPARL